MNDTVDTQLLRSVAHEPPDHEPDYDQLVRTGLARGKRRRRIRRMGTGVVGAVTVSAAVGGVAFAMTLMPTTAPGISLAPAGPPTPAATTPSPTETAQPVVAQDVLATLRPMLPKSGEISKTSDEGNGFAHLRFTDALGTAWMSIATTNIGAAPDPGWGCPTAGQLPGDKCSVTDLDGGKLMVATTHQYPGQTDSATEAFAIYRRADGAEISFTQINRIGEKTGGTSRETVPLSSAKMKAIVTSESWELPAADGAGKAWPGKSKTPR